MGQPTPESALRVTLFGTAVSRVPALKTAYWACTWLPLVVLATLPATASANALLGFLADAEAMARVFLSVPALLIGGALLDQRFALVLDELLEHGLLPPASRRPLQATLRRFESPLGFLVLSSSFAVLAVTFTAFEDPHAVIPWRGHGPHLSPAGIWYRWVSTPLYRFLWLRLGWSLCMWVLTMRVIARWLRPCVFHPDRLGGLGRFILAHATFAVVLFGLSASAAGTLANQMLYRGRTLDDVQLLLWVFVAAIDLPALLTLLPLGATLYRARRATLERLDATVVRWARLVAPRLTQDLPPPPPETHDLAAHADLIACYNVVERTIVLPFRKGLLLLIVGATLLPMIPVLLLGMPLAEVVSRLTMLL